MPTTTTTKVYKSLVSVVPKASSPKSPLERIFLVLKFIRGLGPLTVALGDRYRWGRQLSESRVPIILDTRRGQGHKSLGDTGCSKIPLSQMQAARVQQVHALLADLHGSVCMFSGN